MSAVSLEERVEQLQGDVRMILREFSHDDDMPPGSIPRIEAHLAQINGNCVQYAKDIAENKGKILIQEDRWKWLRYVILLASVAGGGGGIAALAETLLKL